MSQELLDAIVTLLSLVISLVMAALVPQVRQFFQVKIAAIQHEQLRLRIADLVNAAEQLYIGVGQDEAKLLYVTEHAYVFVQELGLKLTREQVRTLIEAAVRVETGYSGGPVTVLADGG